MKPVLLVLNIVTGGDLRKQVSIALVTVAAILALPIISVASMGPEVLAFLDAAPSAEAAKTQGFYMGGPVTGNTYAWGNCTYWAFAMRLWAGAPISTTWGNANTWDDRAEADGYIVNRTPVVGAVFQTDEGQYGHVAYVIKVDAISGEWIISEMNAPNLNVVSHRTFKKESAVYYKFIHTKKGAAPWIPNDISPGLQSTGLN